jgi:hypothetical protein
MDHPKTLRFDPQELMLVPIKLIFSVFSGSNKGHWKKSQFATISYIHGDFRVILAVGWEGLEPSTNALKGHSVTREELTKCQ